MKKKLIVGLLVAAIVTFVSLGHAQAVVSVWPTVETDQAYGEGDDADDPAIWVHPTDPSLSTIIGTSKHENGGLHVYGLDGRQIQFRQDAEMNNVDIRYNLPLSGEYIDIVAASNPPNNAIAVYKVNPLTRQLENIAARIIRVGIPEIYGFCLYHSPITGRFYAFVTDYNGSMEQWELYDNGSAKVDGRKVRSFSSLGSDVEGCVADDELAVFYASQEDVAIWKFGAEPTDSTTATRVDSVGGGRLVADVEGLTIYYTSDGGGYLIASSQGDSTFAVYDRSGSNDYIGNFRIASSGSIDNCADTDGVDVTSVNLGPAFPNGLFVAHDSENWGGSVSNYKLVPWNSIANAFSPPLTIDTGWDPRQTRKLIRADFTGDCVVDACDLDVLATDWLLQGSYDPVGTPPDDSRLVVRYTFDETSGSTAADSSANGYNGQVRLISNDAPTTNAWDSSGYNGKGCINFDGTVNVVVPQAAFSGINSAITVSLWVSGDQAKQPDQDWGMPFHGGTPSNDRLLHTHIPTKYGDVMLESGSYNAQRLFWEGAGRADWAGQWNHYAFTLDSNKAYVRIYHNGGKKAEGSASLGVGGIQSFTIGCGIFAGGTVYEYFGKIDDLRIYNYALSDNEVLNLASDGQKYTPPDSPANLVEDDVINLKDFGEFASQWLETCRY
jgi:3-phytase